MARLYANENFALPVVEVLRNLGHDVFRAREIITSYFRIPSSGHLGPIFTRTILSVGFGYACGCAPADRPNLPQIWARIL